MWVKLWVSERGIEWVREWVSYWVSEWVIERASESLREWVSYWMSEWVIERVSELLREWVSYWESEWVIERVSELLREWMTEGESELGREWNCEWDCEWLKDKQVHREASLLKTRMNKGKVNLFGIVVRGELSTWSNNQGRGSGSCGQFRIRIRMFEQLGSGCKVPLTVKKEYRPKL